MRRYMKIFVDDFRIFLVVEKFVHCIRKQKREWERVRNKIDRILFEISIINICSNAIFSNDDTRVLESVNFTLSLKFIASTDEK